MGLQSTVRRGIIDDGSEFLLPLQVAKTFGDVLFFIEAGNAWIEHGPDEWIYGIAAEYEVTDSFALFAEFFGLAVEGFRDDELIFNLGFKWHFNNNVALIGSAGRSLRAPAEYLLPMSSDRT